VTERSEAKDVEIRGKKKGFVRFIEAISEAHSVDGELLLRAGRQRRWVAVSAQLVYLARQWCGLMAKELGRRLHQDASMISRLHGWYETHRDAAAEKKLARMLAN
jgi:hypothetical protein